MELRHADLTQFRDALALIEQRLGIPADESMTTITRSGSVEEAFRLRFVHDRRLAMTNILPYRKRRAADHPC